VNDFDPLDHQKSWHTLIISITPIAATQQARCRLILGSLYLHLVGWILGIPPEHVAQRPMWPHASLDLSVRTRARGSCYLLLAPLLVLLLLGLLSCQYTTSNRDSSVGVTNVGPSNRFIGRFGGVRYLNRLEKDQI
jgi:hypothetical protein